MFQRERLVKTSIHFCVIEKKRYTLTRSSRFDLIVQYYIEKKNFNIVEINVTLYEFDQTLLGV